MTATGQTKINSLLQRHYRNSQWLTAIDDGVMYRTGEEPTLFSALSCYNSQLGKKFHIGAVSALEMQGLAHYVPLGRQTIVIYCLFKNVDGFRNFGASIIIDMQRCDYFYPISIGKLVIRFPNFLSGILLPRGNKYKLSIIHRTNH